MKDEKRSDRGVSLTRRRFLKRTGKATVGLASLMAVGPAIVASTSKSVHAGHADGHACLNLTDLGEIVARVPVPVGSAGNRDIEIIRDGDKPPTGTADPLRQYDTFDGIDISAEDWIGYACPSTHTFHQVVFQEGMHFWDGGWFESLTVQVRQGRTWVPVTGLSILPDYPFADNGVSYESYTLTFDEVTGDGIRLVGAPGGFSDFISVAELEIFGDCERDSRNDPSQHSPAVVPEECTNWTQDGQIIARVTSPTGGGNHDIEVIRDGNLPPVGSGDSSRQYDTHDGANSADNDWIGYEYSSDRTFDHIVFQEGRQFWNGGWFETLTVQVRQGGSWQSVSGLSISPDYPFADNDVSFEIYTLIFDEITGDAIRIFGAPGGSHDFISVAELAVYWGNCWEHSYNSNHNSSNNSNSQSNHSNSSSSNSSSSNSSSSNSHSKSKSSKSKSSKSKSSRSSRS